MELSTLQVLSIGFLAIAVLREILTWALSHTYDHAEQRRAAFPPGRNKHPNLLESRTLKDQSFRHEEGFFEGIWWQKFWRANSDPKGVLIMFHGYADHCDFLQVTHAHELVARTGCAVVLFDQPSFGRSQGLWGFIPHWQRHVEKCTRFVGNFVKPFATSLAPNTKVFAVGSSMGGGVILTAIVKNASLFNGVVLLAPMCRISPSLRPALPVELLLRLLALIVPEWPVTPAPELAHLCYRESAFAEIVLTKNHLNYKMKPRLGTALSLLEAQTFISNNMEKVVTPFLLIHGTADLITNPCSSEELANCASAKDKQLELLADYHHCLMGGGQRREFCETPYNLISNWIKNRL